MKKDPYLKELESQNEKYKKALKFYASEISWATHLDDPFQTHSIIVFDDHEWVNYGVFKLHVGGKRAREALKE